MQNFGKNAFLTAAILSLIDEDLHCASDDADLRRRLARNGYGFRDTDHGRMLITLPHRVDVCQIT